MSFPLSFHRDTDQHTAVPYASLLCSQTASSFELASTAAIRHAADHLSRVSSPSTGATAQDLQPSISSIDLDAPLDSLDSALDELTGLYLKDAVYFHDPHYAAHLNCPVVIPAVAAEALVTSINSSMDTFDQSAGATLIERRLVEYTAGLIGYDPRSSDGIFTSGGTQSNLQAMLIARNMAASKLEGPLPERLGRLRIYCSEDAHFSIRNAAMLLGLGAKAAIAIETDSLHRMDPRILRCRLEEDTAAGLIPMAISATAGTTDFGSIDPLPELRRLADSTGAWFHVDAAYGCGLLLSKHHRERLSGIEAADSVTVDYHKSFFQPIGSSALIVRRSSDFQSIAHYSDYLNPQSEAASSTNQVDKSLQTTRRFDALKLWVTLRTLGTEALGEMFDHVIELAQLAEHEIAMRGELELVAPVQLSTLVFRFIDPSINAKSIQRNELANEIRRRLHSSGDAMIAATTVDGERLLKMTLLNPNTSLTNIAEILDAICSTGHQILREQSQGANL